MKVVILYSSPKQVKENALYNFIIKLSERIPVINIDFKNAIQKFEKF